MAGSKPHSIFIVVDLPQPLDAEETEDLAPLDPEANVIDRGETAEPLGQAVRLDEPPHRPPAGRGGITISLWPLRFSSGRGR